MRTMNDLESDAAPLDERKPPGPLVGQAMRALDGCTAENNARDVVEMMDEMELDFMPVVADLNSRRVVGVVSRAGLENAVRVLGMRKAMVRAAALIHFPLVEADVPLHALQAYAGPAPAYVVVDGHRLLGIYENVRR